MEEACVRGISAVWLFDCTWIRHCCLPKVLDCSSKSISFPMQVCRVTRYSSSCIAVVFVKIGEVGKPQTRDILLLLLA